MIPQTLFEEFDIDVEFLNLLFLQWVFLEGRNFQLTLPKPLCLSDHGMAFLMMFMSLESLLCALATTRNSSLYCTMLHLVPLGSQYSLLK